VEMKDLRLRTAVKIRCYSALRLCSLVYGWKCFERTCTRHHQGRIEPNWEVTVYVEVGEGRVWLVMAEVGESRTGHE
jgi:hypothetical protein